MIWRALLTQEVGQQHLYVFFDNHMFFLITTKDHNVELIVCILAYKIWKTSMVAFVSLCLKLGGSSLGVLFGRWSTKQSQQFGEVEGAFNDVQCTSKVVEEFCQFP